MQMDLETRVGHCTNLAVLDEAMIATLQGCSEELKQTLSMATEVCKVVAQGTNGTKVMSHTLGNVETLEKEMMQIS